MFGRSKAINNPRPRTAERTDEEHSARVAVAVLAGLILASVVAGMLGLTIETVSRALTSLERDGVIKRKGARGIELVDPARLGMLAAR